ncbi:hypothetical protein J437_LFUL003197 [Ladona fulva]|uniref:HAT C-terminal dimerisation domain-containing protein n=1 Tax=Ladona fulva TaxID=123851 RepID=A0A8K0JYK9_LADFU|nr:hypothetical protein J437_LFUL003197 [Ladona fulva]
MSKIWEKFDSFVAGVQQNREVRSGGSVQVNKYVDEPILRRNSGPLKWWGARKTFYHELCDLARRALCIVASSVPSERIFSKAGQIVTDRRNKLAGKKSVSNIIFEFIHVTNREKNGNEKKNFVVTLRWRKSVLRNSKIARSSQGNTEEAVKEKIQLIIGLDISTKDARISHCLFVRAGGDLGRQVNARVSEVFTSSKRLSIIKVEFHLVATSCFNLRRGLLSSSCDFTSFAVANVIDLKWPTIKRQALLRSSNSESKGEERDS